MRLKARLESAERAQQEQQNLYAHLSEKELDARIEGSLKELRALMTEEEFSEFEQEWAEHEASSLVDVRCPVSKATFRGAER